MYGWCTKCRDKYPEEYTWVVFNFILRVDLILFFWGPLRFFILWVALISLPEIWLGTIVLTVEAPSKTTIRQQVNWTTKIILYIINYQTSYLWTWKTNLCIILSQLLAHQDHPLSSTIHLQMTKTILYISQVLPRGISFSNFPFSAIAVAVLCFPFGIIGCCMLKEKQCVKCNRSFS